MKKFVVGLYCGAAYHDVAFVGHGGIAMPAQNGDVEKNDNRCTSKVTPLLAEPLCCAVVSYRYVSDHLYLGRLPAAGGPGSPELVLDSFEAARSTLPGAACSISQESYDLTQQVSQPTTVPKNNLYPGEKR